MVRQEWNRKEEPEGVVLEHIRALLLALAVLVDRAVDLPMVERLRFLAVLANGEAEARSLIVAMASDRCPGDPAGACAPPAATAGDAVLLAARFRVLALAVGAVLAQAGPRRPCRHGSLPALLPALLPGCRSRPSQGRRAVTALPPLDTS